MPEILKLVDKNVDGCGTDAEEMIQIEGDPSNDDLISDIEKVISNRKSEDTDWDTGDILSAVCVYLEGKGYSVKNIYPTVIEF